MKKKVITALKIIALLVFASLMIVALVRFIMLYEVVYRDNVPASNNNEEIVSKENVTVSFMNLPEVSSDEEFTEVYRTEVLKRQAAGGNFIKEEEAAFFEENGYNIRNYEKGYMAFYDELYNELEEIYFPVLYKDKENTVYFFYTGKDGDIEYWKLPEGYSKSHEYLGNAHTDVEHVISRRPSWTVTYEEVSGEIQLWQFGKVEATYNVPAGSVYAGLSEFEGYIFRSNTDVYSLNEVGMYWINGAQPGVEVIAHNVAYVIDADYYHSSDAWCAPLFVMTDGSLKAYINWEGEGDADSATHLVDIAYEGGYDKYFD